MQKLKPEQLTAVICDTLKLVPSDVVEIVIRPHNIEVKCYTYNEDGQILLDEDDLGRLYPVYKTETWPQRQEIA